MERPLIIALPKGRIAEELVPILAQMNIIPEAAFFDEKSRLLQFKTNQDEISLVRVRSFDVATFVAFGAAHMGVTGKDVLMEFDYPDLYAPLDLSIGLCRISLAGRYGEPDGQWRRADGYIRVATKYPRITKDFFSRYALQAECVKLHGAMELAPLLDLCPYIVDLVSTGNTLKENGLIELQTIAPISSQFIVNRTALKTRMDRLQYWINQFEEVVHGAFLAE
jgi:ATP phosphoribosyltransferase